MGELVALGFKDRLLADALLYELNELGREYPVDIEDAAVMVKNDDGNVEVIEEYDPFVQFPISGALYFGFLGAVLGWIFTGGPFIGLQIGVPVGWILGAVAGRFAPVGLPREIGKEMEKGMQPGDSVLLVSARNSWNSEKIVSVLKRFDGKVLKTTLPPAEDAQLRKVLASAN